jgi:hypothetical protein
MTEYKHVPSNKLPIWKSEYDELYDTKFTLGEFIKLLHIIDAEMGNTMTTEDLGDIEQLYRFLQNNSFRYRESRLLYLRRVIILKQNRYTTEGYPTRHTPVVTPRRPLI